MAFLEQSCHPENWDAVPLVGWSVGRAGTFLQLASVGTGPWDRLWEGSAASLVSEPGGPSRQEVEKPRAKWPEAGR